ncbi:WhiB family transcriptional regulator [Curtobacterium sp. MCBD17_040]|uniref:WhiB family transcriptional regulator n=1 Tax=Curtobacterium sp. MCBD17_040 TaxID=2175674 RepID=UPI001C648ECF|nr:WhiB family transcriptional regulator [Curtobacterium sp. MCBD17_040]WIB65457.1 WhiB family transcriptional regulator [Curtobacterium sp. MCBD17_040]
MTAGTANDRDWREQAECRFDPDMWFETASEDVAKEICNTVCTVREQCLAYALGNGEQFGVHGGHTAAELAELPGFARAASTQAFAPEPDASRFARYARIDRRAARTSADPLAELAHPADRKHHSQ